MANIENKVAENLVFLSDAAALKAALVCRVKRNILNLIQADEETPWLVVKERLKKAYGGGRWTPEEDIFKMFRTTKSPRQSNGQYAETLLARFNQITEKMRDTTTTGDVEARMAFLATILKVQLAKETGKREGLPADRTFVECAQEMADSSAREEETHMDVQETGWSTVTYRRPKTTPTTWKRKEPPYNARQRERPAVVERRPAHFRPKTSSRREDRKCHGCGKTGHLVAQCPRTRCYECGTEGHIARQCPYIYKRELSRDEPMEINAQKIRRRSSSQRSVSSRESTDESGSSENEDQNEPESRGCEASSSRRRIGKNRRWQTVDRI